MNRIEKDETEWNHEEDEIFVLTLFLYKFEAE